MSETSPRLREELGDVPGPRSGPSVEPSASADWPVYRLSSNENPYPPLPSVQERIVAGVGRFNRYPDIACSELTDLLAQFLGVPESHIALGTGSVGVTQQLLQAAVGPGDEVLYAWRSFETYPVLTRIVGGTSVQIPLVSESHDLDAMAEAISERTRLIFVCNPNNPTGTIVRKADLERFLDQVPSDVLVVLDEAYIEFVRDGDFPNGVDIYRDRSNVCVLRTFSKAYGLAGLRVGFAVAHPPVAAVLRKTAVPFGVSQFAQDAAVASLCADAEMRARVAAVLAERDRVTAGLMEQGWEVPSSHANFVWLRTAAGTDAFARTCEEEGILVRDFSGEGIRITIGEPAANDRFLYAAKRFSKSIWGLS